VPARAAAVLQLPGEPIEADEMFSGGLLTHPVQQPDKSVLMLGHRDNEIFMVATPALQAATGLQNEALTHRDLLMGGPARDELWKLDKVRAFLQKPGSEKWEAVKLTNATADFYRTPADTAAIFAAWRKTLADLAPGSPNSPSTTANTHRPANGRRHQSRPRPRQDRRLRVQCGRRRGARA